MRWWVIASASLGVNVVLAALWLASSRHSAGQLSSSGGGAVGPEAGGAARTNYIVHRQFFSWKEVESPDYPTYIANLRDIGCPEQTIRDIIIADVNALYSRRRATEILTPAQQWWRSEPDQAMVQEATARIRALDEERRGLLASLLGPNWESSDMVSLPRPSRPGLTLDGPVLGQLPTDIKQSLQSINLKSQERLQAYLEAQRKLGKEADPVALAKIRQQTRDELASVLAPPQLEEFLLRYSQYAANLRGEFGQLKYFHPTPDEFRAVFRATDSLDQQIELLADATDYSSVQARNSLETQRQNAIKLALGPKRYQEYRQLHDPLYREAVAAAQQAGTPDAVQTIYQINLASAQEQQSILGNTNLTAEQKNIALKSMQLDQLKASAEASGQALPPEPTQPTAPPKRTYTLRPGDSPAIIAMIYGVPESAIRAANPGVNLSRLGPGASINIPLNAPNPAPAPRLIPNGPPLPPGLQ